MSIIPNAPAGMAGGYQLQDKAEYVQQGVLKLYDLELPCNILVKPAQLHLLTDGGLTAHVVPFDANTILVAILPGPLTDPLKRQIKIGAQGPNGRAG